MPLDFLFPDTRQDRTMMELVDARNGGDTEISLDCQEKAKPEPIVSEITDGINRVIRPFDLEAYPFQVSWYNELVGPKFVLDYEPSTLCYVILSGPAIFEKAVLPFIATKANTASGFETKDPLDESMKSIFGNLAEELTSLGFSTDVYHDFELHHTRRPKVLVQTAAHVAGAVEYVIPSRLQNPISNQGKKLYGVAVHPEYGGWFAIRGIIVLKTVSASMNKKPGLNLLQNDVLAEILMEEFTFRWKDNVWRDVVRPVGGVRYSDDFIEYLEVPPESRWNYVSNKSLNLKPSNPGC